MAYTPIQPDSGAQTGTPYKAAIEGSIGAMFRLAAMFAPHEQSSPNMTVRLEAGALPGTTAPVEVAAQSTGTITAPTGSDHRIDRVVINALTGAVSVITGTPGALPRTAPAITTGKLPNCQIALTNGMTVITNNLITDERILGGGDSLSSLATAANDFLVASGPGVFVKKTLAETAAIIGGLILIAQHDVVGVTSNIFTGLTPRAKYKLVCEITMVSDYGVIAVLFNADAGSNYACTLLEFTDSDIVPSGHTSKIPLIYGPAPGYGALRYALVGATIEFENYVGDNKKVKAAGRSFQHRVTAGYVYYTGIMSGVYIGAADLTSVSVVSNYGTFTGRLWLYQVG